jgi:hypothetical protein
MSSQQRMVKQCNPPFSFKPQQCSRVGLLSCRLFHCLFCMQPHTTKHTPLAPHIVVGRTSKLSYLTKWLNACYLLRYWCLLRMVKQRNLPFSFQPERCSRVGLLPLVILLLLPHYALPVLRLAEDSRDRTPGTYTGVASLSHT